MQRGHRSGCRMREGICTPHSLAASANPPLSPAPIRLRRTSRTRLTKNITNEEPIRHKIQTMNNIVRVPKCREAGQNNRTLDPGLNSRLHAGQCSTLERPWSVRWHALVRCVGQHYSHARKSRPAPPPTVLAIALARESRPSQAQASLGDLRAIQLLPAGAISFQSSNRIRQTCFFVPALLGSDCCDRHLVKWSHQGNPSVTGGAACCRQQTPSTSAACPC